MPVRVRVLPSAGTRYSGRTGTVVGVRLEWGKLRVRLDPRADRAAEELEFSRRVLQRLGAAR